MKTQSGGNPGPPAPEVTDREREQGRMTAAWIKAARGRWGWKQAQLAAASGVSKSYLSVLENGGINNATGQYQRPSEEIIEKIAAATEADENAGRIAAGYLPLPDGQPRRSAKRRIYLATGDWVEIRETDPHPERTARLVEGFLRLIRDDETGSEDRVEEPDQFDATDLRRGKDQDAA